jgi:hypothetical protein
MIGSAPGVGSDFPAGNLTAGRFSQFQRDTRMPSNSRSVVCHRDLLETEPICKRALIAGECKSTLQNRLLLRDLLVRLLRSVWQTSPQHLVPHVRVVLVRARPHLPDVCAERAVSLVRVQVEPGVVEVKIVDHRVPGKRRVLLQRRQVDRRTAWPPPEHPSREQIRTLPLRQLHLARRILDRVVHDERVELGRELLQLTEHEERPVLGPRWTLRRLEIAVVAEKQDAGRDHREAWLSAVREPVDVGLAETVEEAKVCRCK